MTTEEFESKWIGKEPPKIESLGEYPIAFPGLTIFHGLSGSMKSFGSVSIAENLEYNKKYYLDFEGNSSIFKEHCNKNNVVYMNMSMNDDEALKKLIADITSFSVDIKTLIIIDSFSRVFDTPVNETHHIDKILKSLKGFADEYKFSILLIDHSRRLDNGNIDIRGGDNKKKFADMVLKVKKTDIENHKLTIQIEKSRLLEFKKNDVFTINTLKINLRDELKKILKSKNILTRTDANKKLSTKQRLLYKEYKDEFEQLIKEIQNEEEPIQNKKDDFFNIR